MLTPKVKATNRFRKKNDENAHLAYLQKDISIPGSRIEEV